MSESSEVVGGGTSVAVAIAPAPEVSAAPVEEGGGGTPLEDAPRETEESAKTVGTRQKARGYGCCRLPRTLEGTEVFRMVRR